MTPNEVVRNQKRVLELFGINVFTSNTVEFGEPKLSLPDFTIPEYDHWLLSEYTGSLKGVYEDNNTLTLVGQSGVTNAQVATIQLFELHGERIGRENTVISLCAEDKCCNPNHLLAVPKKGGSVRSDILSIVDGHPEFLSEFKQLYRKYIPHPSRKDVPLQGIQKVQYIIDYMRRKYIEVLDITNYYRETLIANANAWNFNISDTTITHLVIVMKSINCPKESVDLTSYRLLRACAQEQRGAEEMKVYG